ncbi:MAG TPA: cupredoxin domain-containing protein [Actinomycetota bacterium]|nr:cupredoxin domain-containing protein [Actinomycetota bacterium]
MSLRRSSAALVVLVALFVASCGGEADTSGSASKGTPQAKGETPQEKPTGGDRVEVEVEAEDFAFEPNTVTVGAGAAIALKFNNRDEGVPHTFTVYETDAAEQEIFDTGNLTGDAEETYRFTAPSESGSYFFRCDVHPEMTGTFVVQ